MDIPFDATYIRAEAAPKMHPTLRVYVDKLERSLIGEISGSEKEVLMDEAIYILERTYDEYLICGCSEDESAEKAIEEVGSPYLLANVHVEGAYEANPDSGIIRTIGRANALSFGLFGCATLLCMVILQLRVYMPVQEPIRLPFSPAQVRSVFPEPLPYPDLSTSFLWMVGLMMIAPLILGWIVGAKLPVNAPGAVSRALLPTVLFTFLMGCFLLPNTDGLLFGMIQVLFWIPAGCLSAYLSSLVRRHRTQTHERSG